MKCTLLLLILFPTLLLLHINMSTTLASKLEPERSARRCQKLEHRFIIMCVLLLNVFALRTSAQREPTSWQTNLYTLPHTLSCVHIIWYAGVRSHHVHVHTIRTPTQTIHHHRRHHGNMCMRSRQMCTRSSVRRTSLAAQQRSLCAGCLLITIKHVSANTLTHARRTRCGPAKRIELAVLVALDEELHTGEAEPAHQHR